MTTEDPHPGAGTLFVHGQSQHPAPVSWEEIAKIHEEPYELSTPDVLLDRGIGEYTFIEGKGSILGKGKFSTVYKVIGPDGDHYALKHTPLHPHHPLIAARLLREPTLLAQLPPHPNLIGVQGMKRTEGHFYLIEQYASHHVPLPHHPLPLSPSRAAYILDQLVSVTRDCLHRSRVCHRDLKGENVLVDQDSGDVLILDLGLATQFSASEPKLTTCCGSPAFHSPEIVNALAHPPGAVTYYGPELDIWCIALTLLSLLTRVRFPLGPHHTHHSIMRSRALDRLQELDELYPPKTPWIHLPNSSHLTQAARDHETKEWKRVRRAMFDFLEIDGKKRMRKFGQYQIGEKVSRRVRDFELDNEGGEAVMGGMKSTSFLPADIKYTLPLYLLSGSWNADVKYEADGEGGIVLNNPTNMKERKVLSYIRYLLRSAGIGYHCLQHVVDETSTGYIYQLVLPFPNTSPSISQIPSREKPSKEDGHEGVKPHTAGGGWVASLNPFKKRPQMNRSSSVPSQPKSRSASKSKSKSRSRSRSRSKSRSKTRTSSPQTKVKAEPKGRGGVSGGGGVKKRFLRTWIRIEFEHSQPFQSPSSTFTHSHEIRPSNSRSSSKTRVDGLSPLLENNNHQLPDMTTLSFNSRRPSQSPRRKTSDRITGIRPSPLSRQVSPELQSEPQPEHGHEPGPERSILSRASSTSTSARTRVSTTQGHGEKRSRVIIHSSDIRGYPALRRALDVKHHHHHSGSEKRSNGIGSGSSDSEVSPLVIQSPTIHGEEEKEEERGRPRSKESQKSMVMLEAISSRQNVESTQEMKTINEVGVEDVEENLAMKKKSKKGRKDSRDRNKPGFWSLFASVDSNVVPHRSFSVPPSRELV